jgi:hypothetical protein
LEFCRRHVNNSIIASIWDTQVFTINIHELQVIFADFIVI